MATPKWFLVALTQCQPDQIAAADPPPAFHPDDEDDDKDDDYDYILDADVVDVDTDDYEEGN